MLYKNLPSGKRWWILSIRKFLDFCSGMVYLFTGKWESLRTLVRAHKEYYKMRKYVEPSIFSEEYNLLGHYNKSVVLKYYLSKGKLRWDELEF